MEVEKFKEELALEYRDVKTALEQIVAGNSELKIKGPDDAQGYAQAREVMKAAGKVRRNIEDVRRALNADGLERTRMNNALAGELQGVINPLEERLKTEVQAVDDHHEKVKALQKANEIWPERFNKLVTLDYAFDENETEAEVERLKLLPDAEFLQICNDLQSKKLAATEAENKRLRDEAGERKRIDDENKRIEQAKETAKEDERKRIAQETVNREAEQAVQRDKEMQDKIWPLREERIRALFAQYDVSHVEDRMRNLKPMVVKMDEAAFEKYMAEAKESAEAAVARQRAEMGDREKMADFYKQLLAVPIPVLSDGSIYQSDLAECLGILRDGAQVWNSEPAKV